MTGQPSTPVTAHEELSPLQRATLAKQLGDAQPARNSLLMSFGTAVLDRRDHDHTTQREDWYCLNLAAYMGEKAAPVLRRLIDAELELARLRTLLHAPRSAMLREIAGQQLRIADVDSSNDRTVLATVRRVIANELTAAADEPEQVAPPTSQSGSVRSLSVQHADALWDAVAIPGPTTPTFPEQYARVCAAVAEIVFEVTAGQPLRGTSAGGFQPDRGYILGDVLFCCDAILPHPMDGTEYAVGWSRRRDEREWKPDGFPLSSYEPDGWEDITVDPRDPNADWRTEDGVT